MPAGRLREELLQSHTIALDFRTQGRFLARRDHARGGLRADDQRAADRAIVVEDRRIAVGPVDLFDGAVAEDRHQGILVPTRYAARITASICGPMMGQISGQHVPARLPHGRRMLAHAKARHVGVVVDLDQSGPHHRNIGWREWSNRATVDLRLRDQSRIGPRGVAAQSVARMSSPISPPPSSTHASGPGVVGVVVRIPVRFTALNLANALLVTTLALSHALEVP